jgi:hypothetical protein
MPSLPCNPMAVPWAIEFASEAARHGHGQSGRFHASANGFDQVQARNLLCPAEGARAAPGGGPWYRQDPSGLHQEIARQQGGDLCSDYECSHWSTIGGDWRPDHARLSDIEPVFTCRACG